MRNIKINFEHPSFLYPFRLSLTPLSTGADLERINFKNTEAILARIKKEIILSPEEDKIISSLSISKASFTHRL